MRSSVVSEISVLRDWLNRLPASATDKQRGMSQRGERAGNRIVGLAWIDRYGLCVAADFGATTFAWASLLGVHPRCFAKSVQLAEKVRLTRQLILKSAQVVCNEGLVLPIYF